MTHHFQYDPHGSHAIDRLREIHKKDRLLFGKTQKRCERFCESCSQVKPSNGKPHVKGWQCTDCINQKEKAA